MRPGTGNVSRYWKPGEDDRVAIREATGLPKGVIDRVLAALLDTLMSRRRTKIVGFGVFEWKPWRNRIPTGRMVETWRLAFRPGRYVKEMKWRSDEGK